MSDHEIQGTAYDPHAAGHELVGRARSAGGYNDGFRDGQIAAALSRSVGGDVVELLKLADQSLAMVTAFESDALYIMGPSNFNLLTANREKIRAALSRTEGQGSSSPKSEDTHRAADRAFVDHMVQRFLGWRLPENFSPDNGISFKPTFNDHMDPPMRCNPVGTNLFDARQAEAMVRHMIEGLPQ